MTSENKKAIFIFTAGFIFFWIFKPKFKKNTSDNINFSNDEDSPSERKKISEPTMSNSDANKNAMAKNAFGALKAYIAAYNNGESKNVMDELNREFAKEFKVKVYRRKSDDKLVVCDLDGKVIIINN